MPPFGGCDARYTSARPSIINERKVRDSNPKRSFLRYRPSKAAPHPAGYLPSFGAVTGATRRLPARRDANGERCPFAGVSSSSPRLLAEIDPPTSEWRLRVTWYCPPPRGDEEMPLARGRRRVLGERKEEESNPRP